MTKPSVHKSSPTVERSSMRLLVRRGSRVEVGRWARAMAALGQRLICIGVDDLEVCRIPHRRRVLRQERGALSVSRRGCGRGAHATGGTRPSRDRSVACRRRLREGAAKIGRLGRTHERTLRQGVLPDAARPCRLRQTLSRSFGDRSQSRGVGRPVGGVGHVAVTWWQTAHSPARPNKRRVSVRDRQYGRRTTTAPTTDGARRWMTRSGN